MVVERRGALEPFEDPVEISRRDSRAVVADLDDRPVSVAREGERDGLARAVLEGVGQDVHDDLLHPEAVPVSDDGPGIW